MTSITQSPLLETIRTISAEAKENILAELMRERITKQTDGELIAIIDARGERLGTFVPASRFKSSCTSPPELSTAERAELEHRYRNRNDSISVEEMFKSLDLDAPAPS